MANSLICSETQIRVSSVLNRDVKQYGKKYMLDKNEETCWNSDQLEKILTPVQWFSTLVLKDPYPACFTCFSAVHQVFRRLFTHSNQGENQWVLLDFPESVQVSEIKILFQGGFSAKTCRLEGCLKEGDFTEISHFYPEDNNCLQSFPIQKAPAVEKIKILFENSADFFGRVIVYSLDVLGEKTS